MGTAKSQRSLLTTDNHASPPGHAPEVLALAHQHHLLGVCGREPPSPFRVSGLPTSPLRVLGLPNSPFGCWKCPPPINISFDGLWFANHHVLRCLPASFRFWGLLANIAFQGFGLLPKVVRDECAGRRANPHVPLRLATTTATTLTVSITSATTTMPATAATAAATTTYYYYYYYDDYYYDYSDYSDYYDYYDF